MSDDHLSKSKQIRALLSAKDRSELLVFDAPVSFYHAWARAQRMGLTTDDFIFAPAQ